MATAALISEAQLFRYINGESDVPSDRLVAMAAAADVDAGWLLTGKGEIKGPDVEARPSFKADLLRQVAQTFDELLIESDKSFTPRQRAMALTFIYEALRLEETNTDSILVTDKRVSPFYPDFLAPLRSDNRLETYYNTMNSLEYGGELTFQSMQQFDTLVKLAMQSVFDSTPGEIYFEKMGVTLLPEAIKNITSLVNECITITGKKNLDWLDAGCGNGRHLSFLSQHFENLKIHGFEGGKQALHLCNQLVKSGKLPIGIVEESDFRSLPYENDTMDVVYCRLGLHLLPYIPGLEIGAVKFLSEVKRVLRTGGVAAMLTHEGVGRDYILFTQYHSEDSLRSLAKEVGLEVVKIERCAVNETGGKAGQDYSSRFDKGLIFIFRKVE